MVGLLWHFSCGAMKKNAATWPTATLSKSWHLRDKHHNPGASVCACTGVFVVILLVLVFDMGVFALVIATIMFMVMTIVMISQSWSRSPARAMSQSLTCS